MCIQISACYFEPSTHLQCYYVFCVQYSVQELAVTNWVGARDYSSKKTLCESLLLLAEYLCLISCSAFNTRACCSKKWLLQELAVPNFGVVQELGISAECSVQVFAASN